jgi:glutaredoxin
MTTPQQVELFWRPGCPYCARLRRELRRAGVATREIDIWRDPVAAATVREITGGDETVPAVRIGEVGLVNPSAARVVATIGTHAPHLLAAPTDPPARRGAVRWPTGALTALVAAGCWLLLALSQPHTTFHLAPGVVAAVWPLADRWRGRAASGHPSALAAVGGAGIALAATAVLAARHALSGPTLLSSDSGLVETLVAIAAGAIGGGLAAARRHPTHPAEPATGGHR